MLERGLTATELGIVARDSALRVAIHAHILTHNVLNTLDEGANGHKIKRSLHLLTYALCLQQPHPKLTKI